MVLFLLLIIKYGGPHTMGHGNIQTVTNLCEQLLAHTITTGDTPNHLTSSITEQPPQDQPKIVRDLTPHTVSDLFQEYANTIRSTLETRYGARIRTAETINTSNFAPADLLITFTTGQTVYMECKFGAATHAGIGMKTLTSILGTPAFQVPPELRTTMIRDYLLGGVPVAHSTLKHHMDTYLEQFNNESVRVDAARVASLLTSSGGARTTPDGDYVFATFHPAGVVPCVTFTDFRVSPQDTWDVTCRISHTTESLRLTYYLERPTGGFRIAATHNNKNSTYVYPDGELIPARLKQQAKKEGTCIRIPSLVQCGTGSYNVFVQGHQE